MTVTLDTIPADASLNLRGTPCPINFVRTKLKLETMAPGQILEVWLDDGEPIEQVPDSLRMEGYIIQSIDENRDDRSTYFVLRVQRP
ncbi:MAG: sulfurtransferase TusA family protein [Cyanobacteria bacterium]|nr:sulfurtransferase TusA family protein [Cyanobacteriota bacterium]